MKIAFVGLGRMGTGMVRNLLRAGHAVTAYNRTIGKAQALAADGAKVAPSIAEACRDTEVCWTMLSDDPAVRDAVLSPDGVAAHLPAGCLHISSSTLTVAMSRTLGEVHAPRRQDYLAVPVFGRPDAAEAKKLIAVAGGSAELIERYRQLLADISRAVFIAGSEPWQANLFKLCGNFTLASMLETLGEAFAAVRKSGADHRAFLDIVAELYGSPLYKNYGVTIANEDFDPAKFALHLGLKDIRQMLEAAGNLDTPMPIASLLRDQFLSALASGQAELDWSSVALVSARNAGLKPSL